MRKLRLKAKDLLGNKLAQAAIVMLASFVILRFGIQPPIPASLLSL